MSTMTRRKVLSAMGALAGPTLLPRAARAHEGPGPVDPPLPAPDLGLRDQQGRARRLRGWIEGRVTLVQTIYTGCSSVCPLQGALFAEVQRRVLAQPPRQPVQLLSISIDALGDSPESLARWLATMGAQAAGWSAAVPRPADVEPLQAALGGLRAAGGPDAHSEQVWFFDAQARLRWRSVPLPALGEVMRVLHHLAG